MSRAQINDTNTNPDSAPQGADKINANFVLCDADTASIVGLSTSLSALTTTVTANSAAITVLQGEISLGPFDSALVASGDTTGATDTAALIAAYARAAASNRIVTGISDQCGTARIFFGPGSFFINASNAMMSTSSPGVKVRGLLFEGAGSDLTTISYTPGSSGPLCTNNRWQNVRFRGMTFIGNDSASDFLDSAELSGLTNIQYYDFFDVSWTGSWQYICYLTGGNNNSEWTFRRTDCRCSTLNTMLFVPSSGASDQFLNFWFYGCKFGISGAWLSMALGGSVGIVNCDVSGWSPSVDTYLFSLLGAVHSRGVCSFNINKLRIEHKTDHALFLHNQWASGNISINNLDQGSSLPTASVVMFFDELGNNPSAQVMFSNSQLVGTHNYSTLTSAYNFQSKIVYDNCTLLQNDEPQKQSVPGFVTWTNGGNAGGAPQIKFRNCRNANSAAVVGWHLIMDSDLFWQYSANGVQAVKHIQMVGSNGDAPINNTALTFRLPLNCVITQIRFWKPNTTSGAYNYTVQTTEATPTVLAGGTGTAMQGSGGGAIALYTVNTAPLPFVCNTDLARTIQLVDTLAGPGRSAAFTGYYLIVDYIG
jgi:hypothetical protein